MIDITILEKQLNKLAKGLISIKAKDSKWTLGIKKFFAKKFANTGNFIYASGLPERHNTENLEYLYDLTILQQNASNNATIKDPFVNKTILVLESEWGNQKEIIYDFQKLLMSNSEYKVMVFQDYKLEDNNKDLVFNYMKENINKYRGINGIFILVCYLYYDGVFEVIAIDKN